MDDFCGFFEAKKMDKDAEICLLWHAGAHAALVHSCSNGASLPWCAACLRTPAAAAVSCCMQMGLWTCACALPPTKRHTLA